MRIVIVAWRELAHPSAGGSELVVDQIARGLTARGHEVILLCGSPIEPRPYQIVATGGTYSQYVRAPIEYWWRFQDADVVLDVENGIPFFSPLWRRGTVVCLVHHVHTDQWSLYFPPLVARVGAFLEHRVMPIVYRNSLFVAV